MRLQGDVDALGLASLTLEPDLLVNEPSKVLYPVQDGLNLQLYSWSPGRLVTWFPTRKLIAALEISYSFLLTNSLPKRSSRKRPTHAVSSRLLA